jgi:hypothetical protein
VWTLLINTPAKATESAAKTQARGGGNTGTSEKMTARMEKHR